MGTNQSQKCDDLKLEEGFKRHAFVTHCEDDYPFAKSLVLGLESKGFVCGIAKRDFVGGTEISDHIVTAIHTSKKILAVISPSALLSYWCTYELILTMERNDNDTLSIIPILRGLRSEQLPDVLRQLECVEGSDADHLDKVARMLVAPDVSVKDLLPVGSIGHGLAWSYYCSFLRIILPGLVGRITNLPEWHENEAGRCMSRKIYLLLPESCRCPETLTKQDKRIEFHCTFEPFEVHRAGKPRKYTNSIYKIHDEETDKTYYFVGEFCSVVKPMDMMEKGGVARMSREEKRRQLYRFKCSLEKILNRSHPDKHRLIFYNDEAPTERLSHKILLAVKEDIAAEMEDDMLTASVNADRQNNSQNNALSGESEENPDGRTMVGRLGQHWKYDAFLTYEEEDRELAIELTQFLEGKGLKVAVKDRDLMPNRLKLEQSYDVTKRSKRTILILSDETRENSLRIFQMLRTPEKDNLLESVPPIPVIRCAKENKIITKFCADLTYIDSKEENYKERLFRAVTEEVAIPRLPAGNVAEGFAWSYFYGYLKLILPDLQDRIEHSEWPSFLSDKLYIFMPQSGRLLKDLSDIPGLKQVGQLDYELDSAGNVRRSYSSSVYRIHDVEPSQGRELCFLGEYITPLVVLEDMEQGADAGMSTDARARQVTLLYDRLEHILSHAQSQDLQGKCRLFRYDDSRDSHVDVSRALRKLIKRDEEEARNRSASCGTPV